MYKAVCLGGWVVKKIQILSLKKCTVMGKVKNNLSYIGDINGIKMEKVEYLTS